MLCFGPYDKQLSGSPGRAVFLVYCLLRWRQNLAIVTTRSIIWERLDYPGHEASRVEQRQNGWFLQGTAVFHFERQPCRLDYTIQCDHEWRTEEVTVDGWLGNDVVRHEITVDSSRRWHFDGRATSDLEGCVDIDLGFSPLTNTLPIRRLTLEFGASAQVCAAWLPVPGFEVRPLEQVYSLLDVSRYRYESGGGRFAADLDVDAEGLVIEYPGFWRLLQA